MTKTIHRTSNRAWWGLFICLLATSCNSNVSYSKVESIPDQLWYYKDSLKFENYISSPLPGQDVVLSVRNTHRFPYQNLYLKISMIAPSGERLLCDTLQLLLADNFGNWKGAGWGQLRLNELIVKSNYTFQDTGKYVVTIRHLMRDDYLPGIDDIAVSFQRNGTVQLEGKAQRRIGSNSDTIRSKDVAL